MNNVSVAFLFTFIAGFSTLFGTLPIFFKFRNKDFIVCSSLAFASGVMFCVSVVDLIPEAFKLLSNCNVVFMMILIFIFLLFGMYISNFIDTSVLMDYDYNLYKVGLLSMVVIILHNLPEGIITFISTSKNVSLGFSLMIAIMLHNVPEGISISIPIYYATGSKCKAFLYTLLSALAEPFGGVITYMFLYKYINNFVLGLLFSFIAGMMIQISLCELLSFSKKYRLGVITDVFFILGICFMIINLLF